MTEYHPLVAGYAYGFKNPSNTSYVEIEHVSEDTVYFRMYVDGRDAGEVREDRKTLLFLLQQHRMTLMEPEFL